MTIFKVAHNQNQSVSFEFNSQEDLNIVVTRWYWQHDPLRLHRFLHPVVIALVLPIQLLSRLIAVLAIAVYEVTEQIQVNRVIGEINEPDRDNDHDCDFFSDSDYLFFEDDYE